MSGHDPVVGQSRELHCRRIWDIRTASMMLFCAVVGASLAALRIPCRTSGVCSA